MSDVMVFDDNFGDSITGITIWKLKGSKQLYLPFVTESENVDDELRIIRNGWKHSLKHLEEMYFVNYSEAIISDVVSGGNAFDSVLLIPIRRLEDE